MSEHRIAWALHNYELEQTIIRLRNSRNRLISAMDCIEESSARDLCNLWREVHNLREENCKLRIKNRELSDIIAAP